MFCLVAHRLRVMSLESLVMSFLAITLLSKAGHVFFECEALLMSFYFTVLLLRLLLFVHCFWHPFVNNI